MRAHETFHPGDDVRPRNVDKTEPFQQPRAARVSRIVLRAEPLELELREGVVDDALNRLERKAAAFERAVDGVAQHRARRLAPERRQAHDDEHPAQQTYGAN